MLAQEEEESTTLMMKGRRSKRPRPTSSLALTMSATNSNSSTSLNASSTSNYSIDFTRDEEAEDDHRDDIEDMANCLILLAKGQNENTTRPETSYYKCKTCNKSFSSFQALGGHRASHKKLSKATQEDNITKTLVYNDQEKYPREDHRLVLTLRMPSGVSDKNPNCISSDKKTKSRVHECSICGAGFASGQALGGHMRRHRAVPPVDGGGCHETKKPRINLLTFDLNLPAPEDHDLDDQAFVPKEQVIVFSASSLVDCHY